MWFEDVDQSVLGLELEVDNQDFLLYNNSILDNKGAIDMSRVSEIEIDKAIDTVRHMSLDELKILQDEIQLRRNALSRQNMREITVGANVEFTHTKTGSVYSGNVVKKAIKYVTVDTGMGRWKVPAGMITVV